MSAGRRAGGCTFLFRRRDDKRYWVVTAQGDPDTSRMKDLRTLAATDISPATQYDLEGYVVRRPDGTRFRFRYPHPSIPEPPTPLCSENGGKMPCWIKPPLRAEPR